MAAAACAFDRVDSDKHFLKISGRLGSNWRFERELKLTQSAVRRGRCWRTLTSCLAVEMAAAARGYRGPTSDERVARFADANVE